MGFHDVYVKDIYYVINDRFPSGFIIQTVTSIMFFLLPCSYLINRVVSL